MNKIWFKLIMKTEFLLTLPAILYPQKLSNEMRTKLKPSVRVEIRWTYRVRMTTKYAI